MITTYKYRIRPTARFVRDAQRWLGFCQTLYNAALQERREAWKTGKSVSYYDQQAQLKDIRACDAEAKAVNEEVEVNVLRRLDKAMRAFFRRVKSNENPGYPRFRSCLRYNSFTYPRMRGGFRIDGDKLILSKLGSVRLRLHRPIQGTIKTCTIIRQVDGWYAAFACEALRPPALIATGAIVGVDVGLENFATLSNGEQVENPRFLRRAENQLNKTQRRVSRLKFRGRNRAKAIRLLALRHLRVKRQRVNFAHVIANDLVKRFDKIVIEKLNVKGMVRNHKLAKSIQDAGWSIFTRILAYKAENAGRELVRVNPAYTSQVCSGCGLAQKLKLSQRRYVCVCGLDLHRDHNAAINILASASPVGRAAWAARGTTNHTI